MRIVKNIIGYTLLLLLVLLCSCFENNPLSSSSKNATIYFSNPDGWSAAVGIGRISGDSFKVQYTFTDGDGLYSSQKMSIEPGSYDVYYKVRFTSSGWGNWTYMSGGNFNCQGGKTYKATFHADGWGGGAVTITSE
jgi:hypothetical protein